MNNWYQLNSAMVIEILGSDIKNGLKNDEVKKRQLSGENLIEAGPGISVFKMLLSQFTDTMVLVLLGATIISAMVGSIVDAMTIMAIVIINAILGFAQEFKAEKSMEEMKKLSAPHAMVLRNGKKKKILASELVSGDIIYLETGDKVPADVRILDCVGLEIDESSLTGESLPVSKDPQEIKLEETALADRHNMAFMGTAITRGRGLAVVTEIGMATIMGQITKMISEADPSMTPLQRKLSELGKKMIIICLTVCAMVSLLGIIRGEEIMDMLMAGISLAVAAIPEGLPAIVTVVLALGVQRMSKRKAIVRKLSAVETLGCTTVICSDKTGTLTENRMRVVKIGSLSGEYEVEGDGYQPKGSFLMNGQKFNPKKDTALMKILEIAFNCNNAELEKNKNQYQFLGDPTEAALLIAAMKAGYEIKLDRWYENPFDSNRKYMSVGIDSDDGSWVLAKGALEAIAPLCTRVFNSGKIVPLDKKCLENFNIMQEKWAEEGIRVLALAGKPTAKIQKKQENMTDELDRELVLFGLCGLIDPPRASVYESIAACKSAGIVPVMITGDHPVTAAAIARNIGLINDKEVITGLQIDTLSDKDLLRCILENRVFARVSPDHKNRIVRVLQKNGQIVAMTGDGINDAPAVKAADIGVAMGISGTDVTKEAAEIVLADDDFSTIVKAVFEGRAIYNNIRKFIRYLLGCNIGEVLVMFLATIIGMPLPLLPIQLLWVNLMTDGLPAIALGLEPAEPGIMKKRPRLVNESIFSHGLHYKIIARGIYISIITLLAFSAGLIINKLEGSSAMELPYTIALTTLVFAQLFYVFECRSEEYSPFQLGFFANKFLVIAVITSVILQLLVLYNEKLNIVFHTVPLSGWHWILILSLTSTKFIGLLMINLSRRLVLVKKQYVTIKQGN